MQIVIDIPEEMWERVKDGYVPLGISKYLKNGISTQKYGKWILSGGYWRCSECKEKALLKLDKSKGGCREYEPVRSKHCPSCGIKMQESEKV